MKQLSLMAAIIIVLIFVVGLSTTAADELPIIEVSPLELDFGEVELDTSRTVTLSISNLGEAELGVRCIELEFGQCQDFSFIESLPTCEEVVYLEPGESMEVEISYTPSDIGPCSSILEIISNDPENPVVQVDLKGTGVVTLLGEDYLIITHDNFYTQILPLESAKQAKGYLTKVVKTSEIGVNPTADQIANYIKNEYTTKNPKLKYVLLVGDVNYIPTHYRTAHNPSEDGSIATDLYYATMDSADYLPDICVGRLPVNTTNEIDIMVNKILNYTPSSKKVLFFGAYPELTYADNDRTTILNPAGYVVDTASGIDATGDKIITRINAGRLLVAYYGHGSIQCAGQLCNHHIDPTKLTNTELPVVISGGCFNNQFDHSSIKSLGENLVLTPAGAIAFVGSTRTGGYGYAYTFTDGFYQELSQSGQIGKMLNAGRQSAYDAAVAAGQAVGDGSWTKSFIEKINLLGDPDLRIRPTGCLTVKLYGEQSEEVALLRNFRDSVLNKTPKGREIIKQYYEWSPKLLKAMEEDEKFREEIKEIIDVILPLIRKEVE